MAEKAASGSGQTQRIDIVVTDKGADTVKANFISIGKAAKAAGVDVEALNKLLGKSANTNSIVQAATANDKLTASINKTADAYLKQETALNRAIIQETRAARASADLAISKNKVTISNNEVQISYLKTEQALNDAIRSENRAKVSAIELANATDSQSIAYLKMEQALSTAVRAETMAAAAAVQLATANDRQAAAALRAADAEKAKAAAQSTGAATSITQAGPLGSSGVRRPAGMIDPASIGQAADNMGRFGRNSRLANHEMVNLGYQVQDIFVSLAGGQNPFLVLLQQGSQIQSIYGGRGESVLKAFGDIGSMLLRLINPATLAAAALAAGAYAIVSFANKARDIQNTAKILQLTTDDVQNLGKALSGLSNGELGFDNLKTDVKDFGVAASDAARNADSQFARLWKANGLSLKDQNGKLKDVNVLLQDAARLVKNAGSEFDKISIARIMGLSEEWIRVLEKGPSAILGAEQAAKDSGSTLDKELIQRAAQFDKDWEESWNKFRQKASDVITEVKAWLFNLSQQDWQINLSGNENFKGFPTVDESLIKNPDPNKPGIMQSLMEFLSDENRPIGTLPATADDPVRERRDWLRDRRAMEHLRTIQNRPDAANNDNAPIIPTGGSQYPVIPGFDGLPGGGTSVVPTTGKPKEDHSAEKRADALAKVNRELEAELKLFGMLGPEREKEQKYDDINNSLLQKKIELSSTESEGIRDKINLIVENNRVQQEMDSLYQEFGASQQHYNDVLAASNKLLEKGVINQRQWSQAVGEARIAVLENSDNIGDGIELGFLRIQQQSGTLSDAIGNTLVTSVNSASDALTEFFSTGTFNSANFVNSVIGDIARLVVQYKIIQPLLNSIIGSGSTPAGGGGSGWLGSILGSVGNWLFGGGNTGPAVTLPTSPGTITTTPLPAPTGFAGGGSFMVGGNGGTDKTPVAFGATRGERVTVETPAQQMRQAASMVGAASGPAVSVNIDNSGANGVSIEEKQQRQNPDGTIAVDLIVKRTKNEIANDMARGGNPIANATSSRFNLNQAAGNRQ
jgi:hypothetical protein